MAARGNVLVYTGNHRHSVFSNAARNLLSVLYPDKYVVNELTRLQAISHPWRENTLLLVVLSETVRENTAQIFRNYLAQNGKMLVFCCDFAVPEIGLSTTSSKEGRTTITYMGNLRMLLPHGKVWYACSNAQVLATDPNNAPAVMKTTCNEGVLVVSAVHLALDPDVVSVEAGPDDKTGRLFFLEDILNNALGLRVGFIGIPVPSPGYVLVKNELDILDDMIDHEIPIEEGVASKRVPLFSMIEAPHKVQFERKVYLAMLTSKCFGHVSIYFPYIPTSMRVADLFCNVEGVVIIAGRQTRQLIDVDGKWMSPEGHSLFTLHITFPLSSRLADRLPVLQSIAGLAVVLGVRKTVGYEGLDLLLKWPNDLCSVQEMHYVERYNAMGPKIGSVVVETTTIEDEIVHANIGIGVNISTPCPSISLDSVIQTYNCKMGEELPPLYAEAVIARTVSELEILLSDFVTLGAEKFLSLYHSFWLLSGKRIELSSREEEVTVQRMDEFGFLVVEIEDKTLLLHPDEHWIDLAQNRILPRS